MCIGGAIGAAAPLAGLGAGGVLKDILSPKLPEVKIPERPAAPEKSTRRVRQRASLDPSVKERPTSGLDLFTIELTDLLPK